MTVASIGGFYGAAVGPTFVKSDSVEPATPPRRIPGRGVEADDDRWLAENRGIAVTDSVAQLTPGQRDCLRLVYRHMTSKDIARALDISPHTVDMRLRTAMRTLSVASRIDAARVLAEHEGETGYQTLIYQAPELAGVALPGTVGAPVPTTDDDNAHQHQAARQGPDLEAPAGGPPRLAGATRSGEGHPPMPLANSLPWGNRNRLSPGARLAWIAMIAIGSALGFGAILTALEALKNLL